MPELPKSLTQPTELPLAPRLPYRSLHDYAQQPTALLCLILPHSGLAGLQWPALGPLYLSREARLELSLARLLPQQVQPPYPCPLHQDSQHPARLPASSIALV